MSEDNRESIVFAISISIIGCSAMGMIYMFSLIDRLVF